MMTIQYARIDNGTVAETLFPAPGFTLDQCFEPAFAAACVPVPEGATVEPGWVYANGTFSPPPPPPAPTLDEARAARLAEVMRAYQAAFSPIEAVYPSAEREGWPIQEAEAKALLAAPQADPAEIAPVLSALVQLRARGETPADLAAKVLQNAGQWRMIYALLTGQQQRMYGEVSGLATVEEIQAYPVEYRLP